jgi:hypothetical protein
MMLTNRYKQLLTVLLILAAASVWGYNGWQLFASYWVEPVVMVAPRNSDIANSIHSEIRPEPILYAPKGRDPFTYPNRPKPVQVISQPEVTEEIRLPAFSVQGVIDGTLIVSDPQGGQYFVKIGDRFLGIELLSIQPGSLQLRYQNKDFTHLLH